MLFEAVLVFIFVWSDVVKHLGVIVGIVLLPGTMSLCGTGPSANVTLSSVKGPSKFTFLIKLTKRKKTFLDRGLL